MAMNELVEFCTDYLPRHPELKHSIDAQGDARFGALVSAGRKAGFEFTEDEVRAILTSSSAVELSDDQLEAVAGGRKAGGDQQEYLKITLSDVLVTSV
jgi:predicted ribosomally synthesized peptide with nif11-like leader